MSFFISFVSGRSVRRAASMLSIAISLASVSGCLSIGGRTELVGVTDEGRMKSLENRVDAIERSLGITPPPPIVGSKPTSTTTSQLKDREPKTNDTTSAAASDSDSLAQSAVYIGPGR